MEALREVHGDYLERAPIFQQQLLGAPREWANWGVDGKHTPAQPRMNAIAARDAFNPVSYVAGGIAPPCVQQSEGRQSDVDALT